MATLRRKVTHRGHITNYVCCPQLPKSGHINVSSCLVCPKFLGGYSGGVVCAEGRQNKVDFPLEMIKLNVVMA